MLAILAIAGAIMALSMPALVRMFKRSKLRSAAQELQSLVLATRMQAVKRNQTVILWIITGDRTNCPETGQCAVMWADNAPNNYIQDAGEPTIQRYIVPDTLYFRSAPNGAAVNSASAIAFDGYPGAAAAKDRIVFRGDGTLVPPTSAGSRTPQLPAAYTAAVPPGSINCNPGGRCRGMYLADNDLTGGTANRNVFRISVDDFGRTGHVTLLKWLPRSEGGTLGVNYVPGPWVWAD